MISHEEIENSITKMLDYLENAPTLEAIEKLLERGVLSPKGKNKYLINTALSDIPKSLSVYINKPTILRSGKMCISFIMYDDKKVQKMKKQLNR